MNHQIYTVLIAEDDISFQQYLEKNAREIGLKVVDTVRSGTKLIDSFQINQPDILLLDIGLDRVEGTEACRTLVKEGFRPQLIFITGSVLASHYDLAFELEATDYLTKPIKRERLVQAIGKAIRNIERIGKAEIQSQNESAEPSHFLRYVYKNKEYYINQNQILYVEKLSDRFCKMVLISGRIVETSTPLKDLIKQCSEYFQSPHRSFIVNLRFVETIAPDWLIEGNYELTLVQGKYKIPVSRNQYSKIQPYLSKN